MELRSHRIHVLLRWPVSAAGSTVRKRCGYRRHLLIASLYFGLRRLRGGFSIHGAFIYFTLNSSPREIWLRLADCGAFAEVNSKAPRLRRQPPVQTVFLSSGEEVS